MSDPIVEEVRRYRMEHTRKFGGDLKLICEDFRRNEYQTSCAQACPADAITFGDLNNPQHTVYQLVKPDNNHSGKPQNPYAFRLLERLGTNPKVYYLSSRAWVRRAGDNYLKKEKK